jgi:hypothetical protein
MGGGGYEMVRMGLEDVVIVVTVAAAVVVTTVVERTSCAAV